MSVGQKPINVIVDIANYVMFDIGQPLHAFDAGALAQRRGMYTIRVRNARGGERIETLDGTLQALSPENLLIVDGGNDAPLGIAGVKGGMSAAVNSATRNIILEAAHFDSGVIRKSAQGVKLRTDASVRFENDPPPELTRYALEQATSLIQGIAGGRAEGFIDFYPAPDAPYRTGVSLSEINAVLGVRISSGEIEKIFERLAFGYSKVKPLQEILKTAEALIGVPYKYGARIRKDAPRAFDCSSFLSYIFTQGGIRIPRMAIDQYFYGDEIKKKNDFRPGDVVFSVDAKDSHIRHESKDFLRGGKVPEGVSHCGLYIGKGDVIHASGATGAVVRESLEESRGFTHIVGLRRMFQSKEPRFVVTVPFWRRDIRIKEDLIEEIGRLYGYRSVALKAPNRPRKKPIPNTMAVYRELVSTLLCSAGFSEVYTYVFREKGARELLNPLASDKKFLRKNLRDGLLQSLSLNSKNKALLGVSSVKIFEIGNVFEAGREHISLGVAAQDARVLHDIVIPGLKKINPHASLPVDGNILELDFDAFIKNLPAVRVRSVHTEDTLRIKYVPFSEYPFALRDIAVWVPGKIKSHDVQAVLEKQSGPFLIRADIFDEYRKDGNVSYAFRLVFQSHEKTLSDDEVGAIMQTLTNFLNSKPGWHVR